MGMHASVFLDYYLNSETDAAYAVMLNGPWGAGKTFFIKKYLDDRVQAPAVANGQGKAKGKAEKKAPNYLYASLYGVTSTTQITDQFFSQAHPYLNSTAAKLVGSVISKGLNGYFGTDVNSSAENQNIIQDLALKLEGRILVFDDLERCAMPISEVMGFINSYVEHEGLKVIILANEHDIPESEVLTYTKQKEKLVGKTIQVKSDPLEVLDKLIGKVKSRAAKKTIEKEKTVLLETFSASGKPNYRNLRSILAEYERIVEAVDNRLQTADEALKQLLLYMIATGHEYRSSDLSLEHLKALPISENYSLLFGKSAKSEERDRFDALKARYVHVKWFNPIIHPKILASIYSSGLIDTQAIDAALAQHPLVVGYTETPAWRLLWSWTDLTGTEYQKARLKLIDELSDRTHLHPGLILHVAGIVIGLKEFGDDLLSGVDLPRYFADYLRELTAQNKLIADKKTFDFIPDSYGGLGYTSKDDDSFKFIYKLTKIATQMACDKDIKDKAANYIKILESSKENYSSLYELGINKGNYGNAAILQHIPVDQFSKLLIVDSSPNAQLFASLARRYESIRYRRHELHAEFDWLTRLKAHLDDLARTTPPPFRNLLELRIKYYFELIETGTGIEF
ncbi:hypothetical protein PAGU2196_49810 [Pseudomonas sp. PAGU 2196]|uniref:P-loop NTPase fold protein n=1 Tax=Pseudomonas sp. PAGU 2196 TaxID=2793997 RepID=UPI001EDF5B6F|nr:P-loop NTPase fold protein [Pseudomonas sp. PAGU 2196]GHS84147.1 hypothetical protein PAGU2196_49810 [Pseudomonas sp. PAGU 2196]